MLEERIWGPPCPPPPPFEREKKRDEKRIKVKIKWTEKKRTMNIFFDAANEQRGKCVDTHTDTQLARLKWEHSENCCWSHLTLNTRIRREDLLLLLLVFLFVRCVCVLSAQLHCSSLFIFHSFDSFRLFVILSLHALSSHRVLIAIPLMSSSHCVSGFSGR